nr:MAG TPA: hypothetical protein [Inoviridae sp.]DAX48974.1 MAG TPA: hypothetical protein [Inoviridae sp.]
MRNLLLNEILGIDSIKFFSHLNKIEMTAIL